MLGSIFGKKKRTPEQLVADAQEALVASGSEDAKEAEKGAEALAARLAELKLSLYGEVDKESAPPAEETTKAVAEAFVATGCMQQLLARLGDIPFEARKDVSQIFNNLMRNNHANFAEGYVSEHKELVGTLVDGYANPHIALHVGSMLRECIRYRGLCHWLLYSPHMKALFTNYVHVSNFEVASDAFATLKEALTLHKPVVAAYLSEQFDEVFALYQGLLQSDNYVTRRQSLKLLGELLLDRDNFAVMMRYIADRQNLKLIMIMLRDKRPNIQFEAFHVFKVFVANPKKPDGITKILVDNRDKLIEYLRKFHNDKDDQQFTEEKALLIQTLQKLTMPASVLEKQAKEKAEAEAAAAAAGGAAGGAGIGGPSGDGPEEEEAGDAAGEGGGGGGDKAAAASDAGEAASGAASGGAGGSGAAAESAASGGGGGGGDA